MGSRPCTFSGMNLKAVPIVFLSSSTQHPFGQSLRSKISHCFYCLSCFYVVGFSFWGFCCLGFLCLSVNKVNKPTLIVSGGPYKVLPPGDSPNWVSPFAKIIWTADLIHWYMTPNKPQIVHLLPNTAVTFDHFPVCALRTPRDQYFYYSNYVSLSFLAIIPHYMLE